MSFFTMLCTYLDLKAKLYTFLPLIGSFINIADNVYAVILSSVGMLFPDDSQFCSEVTCFRRNLGVFTFSS